MTTAVATVFLWVLATYLACGLVFALPFAWVGAGRIDPHAAKGTWGFRLLIIPGATALWPVLLRRWLVGNHQPPEQDDPHRRATRKATRETVKERKSS